MMPDIDEIARRIRNARQGDEAPFPVLGEGDHSVALDVDGRWVARVAKHADAAHALRREACAMARVADGLPLPVPRPTHHRAEGIAFSLHARLAGEPLTREAWYALPDAGQAEAAASIARFLSALHAIPPDAMASCGLPRADDRAATARLRERVGFALHGRMPETAIHRLIGILDDALARGLGTRVRPVVLHGDFGPDHVLHDPATGRVTGVIDFGDLSIGDPAIDLVYVHEEYGDAILRRVLSHHGADAADAMPARVRFWYLHRAAEWTLERVAAGDADGAAEGVAEIAREVDAVRAAPPAW